MEVTRTHTFTAPIAKVWKMFCTPEAHVAKFEAMGHRQLEVVETEKSKERFFIELKRLVDVDLPGFAKKVIQPTNTVISRDEWCDNGDGTYGGTFTLEAPGTPMSTTGKTLIEKDGAKQTLYTVKIDFRVKVPLIGGKIESYGRDHIVVPQLETEFELGDQWLAEH
jgi:uncharacterized protein YndB with AHSA1/START domain